MKKVAVLGSSSFAGREVSLRSLEAGHNVLTISRNEEAEYGENHLFMDLSREIEEPLRFLNSFKPNYIFDFMGQGMVSESWGKPDLWYQTNLVAKVPLWESLRYLDSLEAYVRASTPEVYGDSQESLEENASYSASTPYAISHVAQDQHLLAMQSLYGFPVRLLRCANFYGPGQQAYRVLPKLVLSTLWGLSFPLHGGGRSERSFIYSSDFSGAFIKVATNGEDGQVYHARGSELVSIRSLVLEVQARLGVPKGSNLEDAPERRAKDLSYPLDDAFSREVLGWRPEVSLEQGLDLVVEWFMDREHEYTKNDLIFELRT